MEIIGKAMAGHAFRAACQKAEKYNNPLTDYVNLVIAQAKADNRKEEDADEKTTSNI